MNRASTPVMTVDEYFELPETNSLIDELLDGAYEVDLLGFFSEVLDR
jgi:hypothetical protein